MRLSPKLEDFRLQGGHFSSPRGAPFGAFEMPGPCAERLLIVASDGDVPGEMGGWEHVSVSIRRRLPNWMEMSFVKDLFWGGDECVIQFHPPKSEYINNHPNCLHLWRWTRGAFPLPPSILVGLKSLNKATEAA